MGATEIILSFIIPIFIGIGVALTTSTVSTIEFIFARASFIFAAIALAGLTIYCLVTTSKPIAFRLLISILVGYICGPMNSVRRNISRCPQ